LAALVETASFLALKRIIFLKGEGMDGIEELLIAWGDALAGRHEEVLTLGKSADVHVLAKARQFAPGTTERYKLQLVGRDGRSRRAYMAEMMGASDFSRMRVVPMWAVDPVPCSSSKRGGGICNYAADSGLPPHLMRIDKMARELYRADYIAWACLRIQYTHRASRIDKAGYASEAAKQPITPRQYSEYLRRGRDWMRARMYVDSDVTQMHSCATVP
jgi:hypothetical protein